MANETDTTQKPQFDGSLFEQAYKEWEAKGAVFVGNYEDEFFIWHRGALLTMRKSWVDENGKKPKRGTDPPLLQEIMETELVFTIPFEDLEVIKYDDQYLLTGEYNNTPLNPLNAEDLTNYIGEKAFLTLSQKQKFKLFLDRYLIKKIARESKETIRVIRDDIEISEGKVLCNIPIKTNVKKNIELLRNFYDHTTNKGAYLSAFGHMLIAPIAKHIRKSAVPGFVFSYWLANGRRGTGKSSIVGVFAVKGYAQDKDESMLGENSIKSIYMLSFYTNVGYKPIVCNDVSERWLETMIPYLKHGAESGTFGDRGKTGNSRDKYFYNRQISITMNEKWVPTTEGGLDRRFINERFSQKNEQSVNSKAYRDFYRELDTGFMFSIFEAAYGGRTLEEIVAGITECEDQESLIRWELEQINRICKENKIEPFPLYEYHAKNSSDTNQTDHLTMLVYAFLSAKERQREILEVHDKKEGFYLRDREPYPELSSDQYDIIDGKDENNNIIHGAKDIWFTGNAYKALYHKLDIPHRTVTALFDNHDSRNTEIEILNEGNTKSIRTGKDGMAKKMYGIRFIPNEDKNTPTSSKEEDAGRRADPPTDNEIKRGKPGKVPEEIKQSLGIPD